MGLQRSEASTPFPPSPEGLPKGFTAPSLGYRLHTWLAVVGIGVFLAVYGGLLAFVVHFLVRHGLIAYRAIQQGDVPFAEGFLLPPALLFFAFLVRGLFIRRITHDPTLVEVTPADEPALFAFVYRLADETGAPRPRRIYVSPRVNASVFYDVSLATLVFPGAKNLEIGLGLVNALSLDELKAVLGHELGHFAQKTTLLSRWVYVAREVAGQIVRNRSWLDRAVSWLCVWDLRIAWLGWLFALFFWSIRAVLDTAFRLALLAQRALSREMEFQADRVAVAVAGSDSIVHALHRLGPADDAWGVLLDFIDDAWRERRCLEDLVPVHRAVLHQLRGVYGDPTFGETPRRPEGIAPAAHRVFRTAVAQPPRMWSTHPPNAEREASAKAVYVPSTLDPRPAWELFRSPEALGARVTTRFYELLRTRRQPSGASKGAPPLELRVEPVREALDRLAAKYARPAFDPRYAGAYVGRNVASTHASLQSLWGTAWEEPLQRDETLLRLSGLYPASLRAFIESYREAHAIEAELEGLVEGVLRAPGGLVQYRGRAVRRKELPAVLEEARRERRDIEAQLVAHDVACRRNHLVAARILGRGWDAYLGSLLELLHYATHASRDLADAHGYLHHTLDHAFADGSLSHDERREVAVVSGRLRDVMVRVWSEVARVRLPPDVAQRFAKLEGFTTLARPMTAPNPLNDLGGFLDVVDRMAGSATGDLRALYAATLDALLVAEQHVAHHLAAWTDPGPAPAPAGSPRGYPTRVVGTERKRRRLGLWDRFQTADGVVAGTLRLGVATVFLLPLLLVGLYFGRSRLYVVDALGPAVIVTIDGTPLRVENGRSRYTDLFAGPHWLSVRTAAGELLDERLLTVPDGTNDLVYNVGGAARFYEWPSTWGRVNPGARGRFVSAQVMFVADAERTLDGPLRTGRRRAVLDFARGTEGLRDFADAPHEDRVRTLVAHARYGAGDADWPTWVALADEVPEGHDALVERARTSTDPAIVWGILAAARSDEGADERADERAALCARAATDSSDFGLWLAVRCAPSVEARRALLASPRATSSADAWVAYEVGLDAARRGAWVEAEQRLATALASPALVSVRLEGEVTLDRVRRLAHLGTRARPSAEDAPLADLRASEGSLTDPLHRAYRELAQDHPEEALALASGDADVVVFAGTSLRARPERLAEALAVDPRLLSPAGAYALLGLAARESRLDVALAASARLAEDGAPSEALGLLQTAPLEAIPAVFDEARSRASLEHRIYAAVAACVRGRRRGPWCEEAHDGTYPSERPAGL